MGLLEIEKQSNHREEVELGKKMNEVIVVKIGGATLGSHDTTIKDIVYLQQQGKPLVIVHGGGNLITTWQNPSPAMERGQPNLLRLLLAGHAA